jgi:hypothetical protein
MTRVSTKEEAIEMLRLALDKRKSLDKFKRAWPFRLCDALEVPPEQALFASLRALFCASGSQLDRDGAVLIALSLLGDEDLGGQGILNATWEAHKEYQNGSKEPLSSLFIYYELYSLLPRSSWKRLKVEDDAGGSSKVVFGDAVWRDIYTMKDLDKCKKELLNEEPE